ncbi:MAG: hypothetical protein KJZ75_11520 [Hyphomonadaceae bacterium]|nr:hypothetical protein [Hyphomonadaceae bacterium]
MSDRELHHAIRAANRAHFAELVEIDSRRSVFVRPEFVIAVEDRDPILGGVRLTLSGARPIVVCGTAPVIAKTLELASLQAAVWNDEAEPA